MIFRTYYFFNVDSLGLLPVSWILDMDMFTGGPGTKIENQIKVQNREKIVYF